VSNAGDIEASPVVVEFYDQGSKIAEDQLTRIAAGQKGYVTFAWLATPGEHSLHFVVDPAYIDPVTGVLQTSGRVVEKNELDNEKTESVTVGAQSSFLPGFDAGFALAATAGVALSLAASRRRKD
jgi:subtilase family serine protease